MQKPTSGKSYTAASDAAADRRAGIKPGSARDTALDRKRGVPVGKGAGGKWTPASDAAADKRAGIKPGSAEDNALDRKRGVPVGKGKGNWIAGAVKNPGALHRQLGVPQGQKIPASKLNSAANSSNPTLARRANLAKTLKKLG